MKITRENLNTYRLGSYPEITRITWSTGCVNPLILANFPNLKSLDCTAQTFQLSMLKGLHTLTKLKCIYCKLTSLADLKYSPQLREFKCGNNGILFLNGIEHCQKLRVFDCELPELRYRQSDYIRDFEPLRLCAKLQTPSPLLPESW